MSVLRQLLVSSLVLWVGSSSVDVRNNQCSPDKLTVYRVYLTTMWNREIFPKQYPEWRPPAQWSKLIGRSHNSSYELFKLGSSVSPGMKLFAEQGDTNILDQESQGEGGIFDEFNAPAITEGEGQAEAEFFIDGKHSMVSLVSRVVPSPDWFIGIDSFDLCVAGHWVESVILEVDPIDAGSDNGFTFTSPNWPTIPPKPISRITAQDPDHPANSFFYPDRPSHPPIATFQLIKVREYELSREFDVSASLSRSTPHTVNTRERHHYSVGQVDRDNANHVRHNTIMDTGRNDDYAVSSNDVLPPPPLQSSTYHHLSVARLTPPTLNKASVHHTTSSSRTTTRRTSSSKHALLNSLMNKIISKRRLKKNRRGRKMATRRRRDCVVGEWSSWSECSTTCSIGEQVRTRNIIKHARRQGRPCPLLKENKWCGSDRNCIDHKYFDWKR